MLEDYNGTWLSLRPQKILFNYYIRELCDFKYITQYDLLRIPNFGKKSLSEVKEYALNDGITIEKGSYSESWDNQDERYNLRRSKYEDGIPYASTAPITIVCAAIKLTSGLIITGARHYDNVMRKQIDLTGKNKIVNCEQGFIDQFGNFHNRKQALYYVHKNGQAFNQERNRSREELYSEGLY